MIGEGGVRGRGRGRGVRGWGRGRGEGGSRQESLVRSTVIVS